MELLREDTINRLKGYFDLAKPAPSAHANSTVQEKIIIRPDARKFLVRCSRCNINFSVQQRIFAIRYKWTFKELLEILVDPQYKLEVLPNHNPFEKLCQAIESNNQEEITRLLHSPQIDLSTHNYHLLYVASQFGNIEVVTHLLTTIPNIDLNTDNPMVIACEFGHYEIVKLLYDRGADPSLADSFSFRLAAENGHAEIVKLFINDRRINVNAQDDYAVKQACEENHYQVVKILFDHPQTRYESDVYSPVMVDCVHHGGKLLRTLLADNRVGYPGTRRMSKLFGYGKVNYSFETCKILLADGRVNPGMFFPEDCEDVRVIELLMKDERFYQEPGKMEASLIVAAKKGWLSVVQTLFRDFEIYFPEKKDIKMEYFRTVVYQLASKSGHVDIMKFLFENVSSLTIDTLSPKVLLNPIKYNHLPAVEYLVSVGFRPSSNVYGDAYVKAFRHSRFEVLDYLFTIDPIAYPVMFDITHLLIQNYPPESYIKLFSTFAHRFEFYGFDSEKAVDFYTRLCQRENGYQLLAYFIDNYPSCKPCLITPLLNTKKRPDHLSIFWTPRPVDFLQPFTRDLYTVVYYYYKEHCLLLLELQEFLLFDVIKYIFEFIVESGFAKGESNLMQLDSTKILKRKRRALENDLGLLEMLNDEGIEVEQEESDNEGEGIVVDENEYDDNDDDTTFSTSDEFDSEESL